MGRITRRVRFLPPALLAFSCSLFAGTAAKVEHGSLRTIKGYRILSIDGTPGQMGTACGQLLGPTVRRVVRDMITHGIGRDRDA